jgi:hypothetical protein
VARSVHTYVCNVQRGLLQCMLRFKFLVGCCVLLRLGCWCLQVRWLARLSDPAVRFVDKIIGEAVVSGRPKSMLPDQPVVNQPGCTVLAYECRGQVMLLRLLMHLSEISLRVTLLLAFLILVSSSRVLTRDAPTCSLPACSL